MLANFSCSKDADIQSFIRLKAIDFHNRGWSSVYILLDEDKLAQGKAFVEAYFTLSHKVIALSDSVSKSKRKVVFGGIKNDEPHSHFVLIGQLGKHMSDDDASTITATEILDAAFSVIHRAKDLIPFACVLVECREELVPIYETYGFSVLQDDEYIQMIKKI